MLYSAVLNRVAACPRATQRGPNRPTLRALGGEPLGL